jgi:hypothetical protein
MAGVMANVYFDAALASSVRQVLMSDELRPSIGSKYPALASPRRDNPTLGRSVWLALYGIAFVFICNMALSGGAATMADPIYVTLVVLTLAATFLFAVQPILPWAKHLSSRMQWTALTASFVAAVALAVLLWNFNLDDKWVYYRTSKNLLIEGVPNYNLGEWLNINTSFAYAYLMAPGHFFGDYREWELWSKLVGLTVHFATAVLILAVLGSQPIAIMTAAAFVLYVPALLWSLGGLETPIAIFAVVALILFYLQRGSNSLWFWALSGAMIWLRPDAILIGIGIFIAELWLAPRPLIQNLVRGSAFSIPILLFFGINYVDFMNPLPTPFYIKGWNKAFSGTYPWYVDVGVGATHLISGILVSFLVTTIIAAGLWQLFRSASVAASIRRPLITDCPRHFCVLLGSAIFLAYHVKGGYQHMSFTFRYFLPGILCLLVMSGHLLTRTTMDRTMPGWALLRTPRLAVFAILLQLTQSFLVGYHAKWNDSALTASHLRDGGSLAAYSDGMRVWLQAGQDLRAVAKPTDRIWVTQGLATAALTDSYLRDQFYAPPKWSKFEDFRSCKDQNCLFSLCDYILTFPGTDKIPPGFEILKSYSGIQILHRGSNSPRQ